MHTAALMGESAREAVAYGWKAGDAGEWVSEWDGGDREVEWWVMRKSKGGKEWLCRLEM